jgi:hypothetical protein
MTKSELLQIAISNGLLQRPVMTQYASSIEDMLNALYEWQQEDFGETVPEQEEMDRCMKYLKDRGYGVSRVK